MVKMPLALLLIAAALPAAAAAAAPAKLVVAVEAPMSGEGKADGLDQLRGVELAARQANATGGVLGRTVRVIRADDVGDPDNALSTFRGVARSPAVAVIGPYNSSVAVVNLPYYVRARILPVQMASTDATSGIGINVQPKTRQIAPVELDYIRRAWAPTSVAILAGSSPFLAGQADALQAGLIAAGVVVIRIPIEAGHDTYAPELQQALAAGAQTIYVSTKINEGAKIAQALGDSGSDAKCFLGFANQDPSFVAKAGIPTSQRCVFSGVPRPTEFPTARRYVRQYRATFGIEPEVWGAFTYDSARLLFSAMNMAGTTAYAPVLKVLRHVKGFRGATGGITINPRTGDRTTVAVKVLRVDDSGAFVVAPGG